MGSAEPMMLNPRKASLLTAGENIGVPGAFSALTVCIDGNKQNARNSVPAKNLDLVKFERNIKISFFENMYLQAALPAVHRFRTL